MILMAYGFWGYPFLEILFRGWSHWSMALAGGICFGLMGLVSDTLYRYRLPVRAMASAVTVLFVEFIFGCIFNLGMQLHIWDYSRELGNLAGQICLQSIYKIQPSHWGALTDKAICVWFLILHPRHGRRRNSTPAG